MSTLFNKSTRVATDPSLEKLVVDTILTNGSLLLLDSFKLKSLPVNNGLIPNVAYAEAISTIGAGTQASVSMPSTLIQVASKSLLEFTAKNGIHFIVSQTTPAGNALTILVPDVIKQYILNNPNHSYYFSLWRNVTRLGVTANSARFETTNIASNTANLLFRFNKANSRPTTGTGTKLIGSVSDNAGNTLGVGYQDIAVSGFTGTLPSTLGALIAKALMDEESMILYRLYIEDLTVSGRTYAAVSALDKSLKDKSFTIGGKYYGDTYTNPATIA